MPQIARPFQIIQAGLIHVDLVAPLFDAYRQFYEQEADLALARQFILARLRNEESTIFLAVTEVEEALRGLGFVQLYPTFSSISAKKLWVLNDLFVGPEARRQGIGTALMARARQLALETDAKGLVLATATDNPAQHLYEKMGYQKDVDFYHYYLNL